MVKIVNKSTLIRGMLSGGKTPQQISQALNVPVGTVYTVRWKAKKRAAKRRESKAVKIEAPKPTPLSDFVREELANIERQIDNLNVIASFLAIRLRQMEQNGE